LSPTSVGFANVTASASISTRRNQPTLNSFQVAVPTGPWKATRPACAYIASSSAVMSL
jgi:hypothetical protein